MNRKLNNRFDDVEEEVLLLLLAHNKNKGTKRKRKFRRYWVHSTIENRLSFGEFNTLIQEYYHDEEKFQQYFRITTIQFEAVLSEIGSVIEKQTTVMRLPVPAAERLGVTLRYIAHGISFTALAQSYRIGLSTVAGIVPEVCQAIIDKIGPKAFPQPTEDYWYRSASDFLQLWGIPNAIASVDGRHMNIRKPANSGSLHYNYKNYYSIVLMIMFDARYRPIFADVGGLGKNSDGAIFQASNFGNKIINNPSALSIPDSIQLPGSNPVVEIPPIILGDEAFPLKKHIMRPYAKPRTRLLTLKERIFNYRLSRGRNTAEDGLGILAAKYRIFQAKMCCSKETAMKTVMATVILHKFLFPDGFSKKEALNILEDTNSVDLQRLKLFQGNSTKQAQQARNYLAQWFLSPIGESYAPWQYERVGSNR